MEGHEGWNRTQITMRLTPARKKLLRELASRESLLGSPGDILDPSLELALSSQAKPAADLRHVEDMVSAMDAEARVDAARLGSRLTRVEEALNRLTALLAELAQSA